MEYFKLQIACLLIVLFVVVIYIKDTLERDLPCNKYFDALLYFAPWFIIFDGLTAWSVNHLDCFSRLTNLIFHGLFFFFVQLTIAATFFYFCDTTIGLPKGKLKKALLLLPFLVSEGIGLVTLKDLEFLQGQSTNYSMGVAALTCFASVFIYFSMVLFILLFHKQQIEKRKYKSILIFILMSFAAIIGQVVYPEALISSIVAVMWSDFSDRKN